MATTLNAIWPSVRDTRTAVAAARISAANTLAVAILQLFMDLKAVEYGTFALIYPALLAFAAWRTWRLSRVWASIGLALFSFAAVATFVVELSQQRPSIVGVFSLFAMITGVRGAFGARRFRLSNQNVS